MGPQLQMLSFSHQLLFKKVVLKSSYAFYYFRVKNGCNYQNALVASAPYQLLFKVVVLSLCFLVFISEVFFQSF